MSAIQESVKEMSVEELLSLISLATAEAKKKLKVVDKEVKGQKAQKAKKGSMEKGVLPPQLQESFAWVDYVLADAKANGWVAYAVKGKEAHEEASTSRNGVHVFPTTGKEFNRKNAMSLSKFYFSKKEGKGANAALYQKFAAQYVPKAEVQPKANASEVAVSLEVQPKANASEKVSEVAVSSEVQPKAEAKKPKAPKKADTEAPKAPKKVKAASPAKANAESTEDEWLASCPKDDAVYPWEFKGVKYARNHKNHVYTVDEQDEPAYWAGLFNGKKIDSSVAEPSE